MRGRGRTGATPRLAALRQPVRRLLDRVPGSLVLHGDPAGGGLHPVPPDPFTIPPESEYPLTALNARRVTAPPDRTDTQFEPSCTGSGPRPAAGPRSASRPSAPGRGCPWPAPASTGR